MFHFFLQDVRYALRSILKNPLAGLTIVLSLGVGMGITTTAFSILNAMALADLPGVEGQDRLMTFALSFQGDEDRIHRSRLSLPDLRILQGHLEIFSAVGASGSMRMAVDPGAGPELVEGEVVTANYFR
ncbi:MAG: hypothetical protein ACQET1_07790, partial [Gemmatimonadota bacterium]